MVCILRFGSIRTKSSKILTRSVTPLLLILLICPLGIEYIFVYNSYAYSVYSYNRISGKLTATVNLINFLERDN